MSLFELDEVDPKKFDPDVERNSKLSSSKEPEKSVKSDKDYKADKADQEKSKKDIKKEKKIHEKEAKQKEKELKAREKEEKQKEREKEKERKKKKEEDRKTSSPTTQHSAKYYPTPNTGSLFEKPMIYEKSDDDVE